MSCRLLFNTAGVGFWTVTKCCRILYNCSRQRVLDPRYYSGGDSHSDSENPIKESTRNDSTSHSKAKVYLKNINIENLFVSSTMETNVSSYIGTLHFLFYLALNKVQAFVLWSRSQLIFASRAVMNTKLLMDF